MKKFLIHIILNKYFIVLLVVIIGLGSIYFLGNDNPVEEIAEEIIKEEIGIDIDLSPNTPSPSKYDLSFLTKHRRYR